MCLLRMPCNIVKTTIQFRFLLIEGEELEEDLNKLNYVQNTFIRSMIHRRNRASVNAAVEYKN